MAKGVAVFAALCAAMNAIAFSVVDVKPRQRFPWNGKVDVSFTLKSENPDQEYLVSVNFRDVVGGTNLNANTFRYNGEGEVKKEFALRAGTHKITWDADADAPEQAYTNIYVSVEAKREMLMDEAQYIVIDVSGGANAASYPVTALKDVPEGGWTEEYKKTKIVLRRCPKGKDPLNRYTLTKDFYAGVFEITQKQWELVMGSNPVSGTRYGKSDNRPVYCVSYNMIRGTGAGAGWPGSSAVDASSFIGKLRARTGLNTLDLPTEAQWEYACRAGTTTTYNTGDSTSDLAAAGWCSSNSGGETHPVGQKRANAWGLYDMHGNVWEWCLDWRGASLSGTDPVGAASGSSRHFRGGGWSSYAGSCPSSYRSYNSPSYECYYLGFRLFRTVP